MINARTVMRDVSVTLIDEDFVRWTPAEVAGYIDEAVKTIVMVKPSASSTLVTLSLARGTRQSLPDSQRYQLLLDILRNVEGSDGAAGRAIRPTTRAELDSNLPRWHDPLKSPFRKEVRQFVFDETIPTSFFVFPGNDGTGQVEAAVSRLPILLREQVTENQDVLSSWDNAAIGLDVIYEPAIKQFVLYSAFSKEDPAAAPSRAVAHYQAFATALGIQSQVEASSSPNRKNA